MEKAASGPRTGSGAEIAWGRCLAAAIGCCCAALPGWAQEADALPAEPVRLEVNTSSLPRFDSQDGVSQANRVDMALLPTGGSGVGLAVGLNGYAARPGFQPVGMASAQPSMDLGVHWRQTLGSNRQIDLTAWRRMQNQNQPDAYQLIQQRQPLYGARVEMKLAPRKQGLLMEHGFVGVQLQGDARIALKRKDGRPMVYFRNSF